MPLNLPDSAQEIATKSKTDVQRSIPESNPFLKNSVLGALITSLANRLFDFYIQLRVVIGQLFPDTATDEFLERWAAIFGKTRLGASKANGNTVATGTDSSVIAAGSVFTTSSGALYESTAVATVTDQSLVILSLTRSGTVATVVTQNDHGLASNVPVTIVGADQSAYNGVKEITVNGTDSFTFEVSGSPVTPATGTMTADFTAASVPVESQDFGAGTNLPAGETLTLQSPIVGVDNDTTVDFGTIGGGTDQETNAQLRTRMLEKIQNPVAHFNVSDIQEKAREVPGVTRVFVQETTPLLGQVTIYFMRDNDSNPIPDASEVLTVREKILEIKPANTGDGDVFVFAPTPEAVDFTFGTLQPNTATMQVAVQASLEQFFTENTSVGQNIDEDAYRAAIATTVDPQTGDRVETFTLGTPTGDIAIGAGEIGVLGTVTFP